MKLVVYPLVDETRLAQIQQVAGNMVIANAHDEPQAIREIGDADAFFGKLTPPILAAARQLRWVQSPTTSLEHYLFPELVAHPCTLTNTRGIHSDVIADHVFGFILCFARNLHRYIRQQVNRQWEPIGGDSARPTFAAGPGTVSANDVSHMHVADSTLGIVGLGHIGSEIARRGLAFGMHVLAVDPVRQDAPPGVSSLWPMDRLDDLLKGSDFVVIAAPHTPQTVGLFGRDQFRQMKSTAHLINIGRGVIVKLDDLCEALDQREIAGAGLDVFEQEPLPSDHPLWTNENVILTPHVAACSVRIADRHLQVLLDNLRRFVSDEPLENVASKAAWF